MSNFNTFLNALTKNIQYCVQHTVGSDSTVHAAPIGITVHDGLIIHGVAVQKDQEPQWFELKYSNKSTVPTVLHVQPESGMSFELLVGDTMPQELLESITEAIQKKGWKRIDLRRKTGQNLMEKVLTENEDLLTIFNTPVFYQLEINAG